MLLIANQPVIRRRYRIYLFTQFSLACAPTFHYLYPIQIGTVRVLGCHYKKYRRRITRRHHRPHGHPPAIGNAHPIRTIDILIRIFTGEEAQDYARTGSGIDLAALKGVKYGFASIVFSPGSSISRRHLLPGHGAECFTAGRIDKNMVDTIHAFFTERRFSPEIVFGGCRQRGMRISSPNHAEAIGIGAGPRLNLEPTLQGFTRVLILQHPGLLGSCHTNQKIALVPGFKVGELIFR